MPHIDKFIATVFEYGADRLVLASAERAALVAGEIVRHVTAQPLTVAQVQDLVQEILPLDVSATSAADGAHEFGYESPSGAVRVRLVRQGETVRVEVEPASAPAAPVGLAFGRGKVGVAVTTEATAGRVTEVADVPPPGQAHPNPAPRVPVQPRAAGGGTRRHPRIEALFEQMLALGCSDLHLSVGAPPLFRKDGEIAPLGDAAPLTAEALRELLLEITPGPNCSEFEAGCDTDFAYELPERARFRANLFMDRRGMGAVFRCIPATIPTPQEIGLAPSVLDLCRLERGLVLVTGSTGQGKSTTLASMIEWIGTNRAVHVVTLEDPIEFVHPNRRGLVNQREVGRHTESFPRALRAALREDPDVILVGEMRDLATTALAIETAETGHLVLGTVHTTTAASAVDRVIDQFPPERQAQVRTMLADSLRGVIAQVLVKRRGGGRVAAHEVLLVNSAVGNLIREGKTFQIPSVLQTGRAAGMTTLNDALLDLVRTGLVEAEAALAKAPNRAEFKALLERNGVRTLVPREAAAAV